MRTNLLQATMLNITGTPAVGTRPRGYPGCCAVGGASHGWIL